MKPRCCWMSGCFLLGVAVLASGHPTQKGKPGEVNTPPAKGERVKDTVKVNDPAPDFTLADLKGERKVTLSSFRGKQPVVLIFGSYT